MALVVPRVRVKASKISWCSVQKNMENHFWAGRCHGHIPLYKVYPIAFKSDQLISAMFAAA